MRGNWHATNVTHVKFLYAAKHILQRLREHPRLALTFFVGFISCVFVSRKSWLDYQQFLSYGPGGISYDIWGWFVSGVILRPLGVDVLDTRDLERLPDKRSWLGESLKENERCLPRPHIGHHPIPHRQLDQHGSPEINERFLREFNALAKRNSHLVQMKPSQYERHTDAIFVREDNPTYALGQGFTREVCHVHATGEFSAHVVLSPQDTIKVIEAYWGQLHPLAGMAANKILRGRMLPKSYVMLYSPRDDYELAAVLEIVEAAIGYMTGSRHVV